MGTRRPFPPIGRFAKIDMDIIELKAFVKHLETDRISAMLKNLKDDEIRLTKCIDDLEVFHRNMFVLLKTENKTAKHEPENKTAEDKPENETAERKVRFVVNSATHQDVSRDQLECSIVDVDESMDQSDCFIVKTDCSVNQPNCSVNEPDYSVNQPESPVIHPNYSMNLSESFPHEELAEEIFEKIDSPEDQSDYSKDKSDYIKGNSTIDQTEMVKKAVLDLLVDGEREITKIVLHLIFTFSGFQRSLEEAETKVSGLKKSYNDSVDDVKSILKRLSSSVLYLDKTVSKIYTKYFEMLQNISLSYFNGS